MDKIRKINSSSTPSPARSFAGPQTAGFEVDVKTGMVVNPDNINRFVVGNPRWLSRVFDDFHGDVIDARWNTQVGTDPQVAAAIVAAQNGMVRFTTGDDVAASMAVNGFQFEGQLNWKPDQRNLVYEVRVKISAITSVAVFVGFTDQVAALEMPATLGASNALTTNFSDGVGVLFDTAADTDTWWLIGVKANVDATKQNTGFAPVADTYETFRVEVDVNGHAHFYRNGVRVGSKMLNATTPTVALVPVVVGFSRTTASRNVDVDYVDVSQSRV